MCAVDLYDLHPGSVVDGRYEVIELIGSGATGSVFLCKDLEESERKVALKVISLKGPKIDEALARFDAEVEALSKISHPNVVRAYDHFSDGELAAFTMEYVEGEELFQLIHHGPGLSIEEIVELVKQICHGVDAIHDAEIIHRDLTPENVLVTKDGDVKITDFGIARTKIGRGLTKDGGLVGSMNCFSPEYILHGQLDHRADIYAIGVLAYTLVTGVPPYQADSLMELMTQRVQSDPPAPSELRKDCPKALDKIILTAMARDPESRYQGALDILAELKRLRQVEEHVTPQEEETELPSFWDIVNATYAQTKSQTFSGKKLMLTLGSAVGFLLLIAFLVGSLTSDPRAIASNITKSEQLHPESLQARVDRAVKKREDRWGLSRLEDPDLMILLIQEIEKTKTSNMSDGQLSEWLKALIEEAGSRRSKQMQNLLGQFSQLYGSGLPSDVQQALAKAYLNSLSS